MEVGVNTAKDEVEVKINDTVQAIVGGPVAQIDVDAIQIIGGSGDDEIRVEDVTRANGFNARQFHGGITLMGWGGTDMIFGSDFNDWIEGGQGDDWLGGNGDDDRYVFDQYGSSGYDLGDDDVDEFDEEGWDVLDFYMAEGAIDVTLGSKIHQTVRDGTIKIIILAGKNVEDVIGSRFADDITGTGWDDSVTTTDPIDNRLVGGAGNDTLSGLEGNDRLDGEEGNDTLNGGPDDDFYLYNDSGINYGSDIITEAIGTEGGAHDLLNFTLFLDDIDVDLGSTDSEIVHTGRLSIKLQYQDSVEDVAASIWDPGSSFGDTITGSNGIVDNRLQGGDGPDTISGRGGDDHIDGGNDDDILTGGAGNDTIYGGEGDDDIDGGTGNDLIEGDGFSLDDRPNDGNNWENLEQDSKSRFSSEYKIDFASGIVAGEDSAFWVVEEDVCGITNTHCISPYSTSVVELTATSNLAVWKSAWDHTDNWVDLGFYTEGGTDYIYLADLGTGPSTGLDRGRNTINVYRLAEPTSVQFDDTANVTEGIKLRYPDSLSLDSETLMVDPLTGNILIVSRTDLDPKTKGKALLFSTDGAPSSTDWTADYSTANPIDLDKLGEVDFEEGSRWDSPVAGDISRDGMSVLLKSENTIKLYVRDSTDTTLGDLLTGLPTRTINIADSDIRKAIAWANDGLSFITLSQLGDANWSFAETYSRVGGDDDLTGGDGSDTFVFNPTTALTTDTITETNAHGDSDTLDFSGLSAATVVLTQTTVQTVLANVLKIVLSENAGLENVIGTPGADIITGNSRPNTITGGAGNDTLDGGDGSDTYVFSGTIDLGTDTIIETEADGDSDTLDFSGLASATVNLTTTTNQTVLANVLVLNLSDGEGLENVIGTPGADNFTGNSRDNTFNGGAGNDTLTGAGGSDSLSGGGGSDYINGGADNDYLYGGDGSDTIFVGGGADYISGDGDADYLYGGDGNDSIDGGAGNDYLTGGLGNDWLAGGAGSDTYVFSGSVNLGTDTISEAATADFDTLDFSGFTAGGILLDISKDTLQILVANKLSLDLSTDTGIEHVNGTASADVITGNSQDNTINGGAGGDTLYGLGGSDSLNGDDGDDQIYGGNDNDYLYGGDGSDIIYGDAGVDYLSGDAADDNLYGGDGNDSLAGGTGNDFLHGEAGDDSLDGGADNDVYNFEGSANLGTDTIYEAANADTDTLDFSGFTAGGILLDISDATLQELVLNMLSINLSTTTGIENVSGTDSADTITGNTRDNVFYGGAGDDTLNGGAGADTLYGDAGNDTMNGGSGDDLMYGGADDDYMNGGTDDDLIYGEDGDDDLWGGGGTDTLDGGNGCDSFEGVNECA